MKLAGLRCDAKEAKTDGFGEAYETAHQAAKKMRQGFGVKLKTSVKSIITSSKFLLSLDFPI